MTLQNRAAIVGQYTTSGLGGSVVPIFLPDGVFTSITNGRSLDADGEIHIEGIGVVPTVRVPVNEETLFSENDVILEYAIAHLENRLNVPTVDGGEIALDETVEGELTPGERVRYELELDEAALVDFIVKDPTGELDTVLRLYVPGVDEPIFENDNADETTLNSTLERIEVPAGITFVVEVGTLNDALEGEFSLTLREVTATETDPGTSA
jgi:hypothetical protein